MPCDAAVARYPCSVSEPLLSGLLALLLAGAVVTAVLKVVPVVASSLVPFSVETSVLVAKANALQRRVFREVAWIEFGCEA